MVTAAVPAAERVIDTSGINTTVTNPAGTNIGVSRAGSNSRVIRGVSIDTTLAAAQGITIAGSQVAASATAINIHENFPAVTSYSHNLNNPAGNTRVLNLLAATGGTLQFAAKFYNYNGLDGTINLTPQGAVFRTQVNGVTNPYLHTLRASAAIWRTELPTSTTSRWKATTPPTASR